MADGDDSALKRRRCQPEEPLSLAPTPAAPGHIREEEALEVPLLAELSSLAAASCKENQREAPRTAGTGQPGGGGASLRPGSSAHAPEGKQSPKPVTNDETPEIAGSQDPAQPRDAAMIPWGSGSPEPALAPPAAPLPPMFRPQRYLLTVEYIGTSFSGFQRQTHARTVQGALEAALLQLTGGAPHPKTQHPKEAHPESQHPGNEHPAPLHPPAPREEEEQSLAQSVVGGTSKGRAGRLLEIVGSSRTDAGVHALGNTCHVDILRRSKRKHGQAVEPFSPQQLQKGLNHFLNVAGADVSVVGARFVGPTFHARFAATERTYLYRIRASDTPPSIFERHRVWHVPGRLDMAAMAAACQALEGRHDFSSFRASGCQALSPVRNLSEFAVHPAQHWLPSATLHPSPSADYLPNQDLVVVARAPAFLYHQVRLLVGTLKAVGCGDKKVEDVRKILDAKTITAAPSMAPAHGLYLAQVNYPPEVLQSGAEFAAETTA